MTHRYARHRRGSHNNGRPWQAVYVWHIRHVIH
ncbi:hypothetical protein ABH927_005651 [Planotetraspora sp. GP83]